MADDKDKRILDLDSVPFKNDAIFKLTGQTPGKNIKYGKSTHGLKGLNKGTKIKRL